MTDKQIIREIKKLIDGSSLRPTYCEFVKSGTKCPSENIDNILSKKAPICDCGLYCKIYKLTLCASEFNQRKFDFEDAKWKTNFNNSDSD